MKVDKLVEYLKSCSLKTFSLNVRSLISNYYSEMVIPLLDGIGDGKINKVSVVLGGEDKEGMIGKMIKKSNHIKKLTLNQVTFTLKSANSIYEGLKENTTLEFLRFI